MNQIKQKHLIEYGDFQTPIDLAMEICQKICKLGIQPRIVIEPTCGYGNFIDAASQMFPYLEKIIGIEINSDYLCQLQQNHRLKNYDILEIYHQDFFQFDWSELKPYDKYEPLILGNFPWVTNSQQGVISGQNLPSKSNFNHYQGLEAITGKSNFDISEWMLIKSIEYLHKINGYIAILCKTSVARKIISYTYNREMKLAYLHVYKIDAKKYFHVNVDACLLVCKFDSESSKYNYDIFDSLQSSSFYRLGYYNKTLIRDMEVFEEVKSLFNIKSQTRWRSGVKHDCSNIMELHRIDDKYMNGFSEIIDIEDTYLYPLLKGSDIAKGQVLRTDRYVVVTQKQIGQSTDDIKKYAPKTWKYLSRYSQYLDGRKSKIYRQHPRFSVFGVGDYSFSPWKIAICGLYKKISFQLVGEIDNQPTIFDDTVYFLSFENKKQAEDTLELLRSPTAIKFYSSLIFWDDKRPIKASILNSLDLNILKSLLHTSESNCGIN
ncbi:class I SAM-dependent methyltransferase [Calothrix sp. 336/3]|uniref:class I SAM-dependent methyltransferase n=1 Tax=Calothrix sp. 336/3 TaxID=1337936 RepID=UPI0004E387DB|nr:class I SAM-dependent methyltransferase [Calothrix sp. 336/3]AKG23802.1 modification methylase [Calothrix sp. 336/3]